MSILGESRGGELDLVAPVYAIKDRGDRVAVHRIMLVLEIGWVTVGFESQPGCFMFCLTSCPEPKSFPRRGGLGTT